MSVIIYDFITFRFTGLLQPYSCLPYGEGPFHLTVTLCGVAYPVACVVAMVWEVRSVSWISWMSLGATLVSLYAMLTAVMSPHPPLLDSSAGPVLIITRGKQQIRRTVTCRWCASCSPSPTSRPWRRCSWATTGASSGVEPSRKGAL
ncbi:solute carrier family 52, riboflavin transporter, member 3-B [Caerostris darwini]|uniref:Riboflavin transporter n=1 Tax=Caerostris darwini TaxID=1538125 RepID=A0AAV4SJ95_9ARAC|nr:solute carrier family 52, riboflavin transporter, member 3-B [Caerostris darwini]